MTRFVVVGAGAIGGLVGAFLVHAGFEVLLVARGEHGEVMRREGLELHRPGAREVVRVDIAPDGLPEVAFRPGDIVLLAVKGQDTEHAIRVLADAAPPSTPVVCLQNGLENERVALRRFERVLAANVMVPASHTGPGVVVAHSGPVPGIIDVGLYPVGVDSVCDEVTATLRRAGFDSRSDPAVMRFKRAKLLVNVGNAVRALCAPEPAPSQLLQLVRDEARAAFEAAGMDYVPADEYRARRAGVVTPREVEGFSRLGSSTLQSLVRGASTVEADYLNGEIALLGRLHGVSTPANALVSVLMRDLVRRRCPPGSFSEAELLERLTPDVRRPRRPARRRA